MNWILLLPVAGLLFLGLSAVDWALYRLEQNETYQSRWKGFGVGGLVLLMLWGVVVIWPTQSTWAGGPDLVQAPEPPGAVTMLYAWQTELQPTLQVAVTLLARTDPPTLAQVRADRSTLHEGRRLLANQSQGTEAEEALLQQTDTLLGAAYQALGDQWDLVRQGDWNEESRTVSLGLLQREWAKSQSLEGCLTSRQSDCLPTAPRSERVSTIHAWQRAMRLYLLDCLRFDEADPDLAWLPAEELRATRDRLQLGRSYLSAHPLPAWGTQITAAADQLFQAADQALRLEETAMAQGAWTKGTMTRAYRPVKAAWDLLFQQALCAMETAEGACVTQPR